MGTTSSLQELAEELRAQNAMLRQQLQEERMRAERLKDMADLNVADAERAMRLAREMLAAYKRRGT